MFASRLPVVLSSMCGILCATLQAFGQPKPAQSYLRKIFVVCYACRRVIHQDTEQADDRQAVIRTSVLPCSKCRATAQAQAASGHR